MMFLPPRTRPTAAIGICGRCRKKMYLDQLRSDPNVPGLRVCRECTDIVDPYTLGTPPSENISIQHTRPDEPLIVEEE